jgi:glycosyltransferase involved in cell wall biosynthesis
MILGIDASSANKEKRTGVEWYAYHLIQALKEQIHEEADRVWVYAPTPLCDMLGVLPPPWESRVLRWPFSSGWMQGRMSWEMLRRSPDVLCVPAQGLPKAHRSRGTHKTYLVTTIHDVGFRRRPDLYEPSVRRRLEHATKFSLKHAEKIFVPSEFTKTELLELFHARPDQLVVTPLAADRSRYKPLPEADAQAVLQKYRLGRKNYFLTVGRVEAKKNLGTLIRAFEMFKKDRGMGDPFELVFVGSPGFGFETIKKYYDLSPAKSFIKNLGWINEMDLPALMNGAFAYLFPSWYEGFGIPNLEAMACGVPLVTADIGAHREVVGDAGLFVSPAEPEAWTRAMRRITEDAGFVKDLVAKGMARAQQFSWTKTAETTWQTIRSLV